MSINWVMTSSSEQSFVKLPNERVLYTSLPRTSLQISTPSGYTGDESYSLKSDAGITYITNQRIIYLPTNPKPDLKSFSAPILNINDSYARAPFFGPNYWLAICKPVAGGGLPASHPILELRITFREGGAFDYQATFEQIRERSYQAHSIAREHGYNGAGVVDLTNLHLEQLPAYEPATEVGVGVNTAVPRPMYSPPSEPLDTGIGPSYTQPEEPPPGYEEAQVQAIGVALHKRVREEAELR